MSEVKLHWFLPTGGDSRMLAPSSPDDHRRGPDPGYLLEVALAAERLGFEAMLTPTGTMCEDAWVTTASLLGRTDRIKFLVAFRPGGMSPTLAAQMAGTYQRMSGGRLMMNVVTGAEAAELARFGDHLAHDARYDRTGEFMAVVRGAWGDEPFDFDGEHYRVVAATTRTPPVPVPPIYFGGASPAAERVAAEHVDVYLAWGEPPAMVAERVERVRALAAAAGRTLRFGIRFHVITRPTADEAWAVADDLVAGIDPGQLAAAQADFATTQSVGQARMASLTGGRTDNLEVHPNVWAGPGLVRGGAGTALVGSFAEVADRICEYQEVGFDEFILSGYPHLEEAYWVGEGVMPELRRRGRLAPAPGASLVSPLSTFR
jgi:alkanesulfonate monooxygenase